MAEDIAMVLVVLAALYGIADLIGRLAYRLLFGRRGKQYLLTPLVGGREDMEYRVRQLAAMRRFFPHNAIRSLVVDCGLNHEEQQLTQRLCNELRLDFCSAEEILHIGLQEVENTV